MQTSHLLRPVALLSLVAMTLLVSACDYIGITPTDKLQARSDADAKAVGGGCRQSGRSLEECYDLHPRLSKANIFLGWKEMNDYLQSPLPDANPKSKTTPPAQKPVPAPPSSDTTNNPEGSALPI